MRLNSHLVLNIFKIYSKYTQKSYIFQVFNRLLGTHNNDSGVPHTSPITPAELLIALHNIDPTKAELKTVIKGK